MSLLWIEEQEDTIRFHLRHSSLQLYFGRFMSSRRSVDEESIGSNGNFFNAYDIHNAYDFYGISSSEETPMAPAQYYFEFAPRPILRLCLSKK